MVTEEKKRGSTSHPTTVQYSGCENPVSLRPIGNVRGLDPANRKWRGCKNYVTNTMVHAPFFCVPTTLPRSPPAATMLRSALLVGLGLLAAPLGAEAQSAGLRALTYQGATPACTGSNASVLTTSVCITGGYYLMYDANGASRETGATHGLEFSFC